MSDKRIQLRYMFCKAIRDESFLFLRKHIVTKYDSYLKQNPKIVIPNIDDSKKLKSSALIKSKISKAKGQKDTKPGSKIERETVVWQFQDPMKKELEKKKAEEIIKSGKIYEPQNFYIITEILGVGKDYFTKMMSESWDGSWKMVQLKPLEIIFEKLGYWKINSGEIFFNVLSRYLEEVKSKLPSSEYEAQDALLRHEKIEISKSRREEESDNDSDLISIEEEFKSRLIGTDDVATRWWFYSYGYLLMNETEPKHPGHWCLVRLVLTFFPSNSNQDLEVEITNTEHKGHDHYFGKTDFNLSSFKVLVLNLRTDPPKRKLGERKKLGRRQLNIKVSIDGAKGDFFLGQYLNYESNTGRIIGGLVAMEMIKDTEYNSDIQLIPNTYWIPNSGIISDEEGQILSQYLAIKHVIPFFEDQDKAFREIRPIKYQYNQPAGIVEEIK